MCANNNDSVDNDGYVIDTDVDTASRIISRAQELKRNSKSND